MSESGKSKSALVLAALGVVFGDIGTSPLYTLRECFSARYHIGVTHANVLGVLSLIFWSLTIVVALKYALVVMRADNRGQGGDLALLALAMRRHRRRPLLLASLVVLGIFGTALFCGDGMITPAISVLSAIEGLVVVDPQLDPYIVPLSLLVLGALFVLQARGTDAVGALFGPVTLCWFMVLAALGVHAILRQPVVIASLSPSHALAFIGAHSGIGFLVLGAVVLAFTGAEALYADMGHFGRMPIRVAWYGIVWPALMLNYLGQGALLLDDPTSARSPFYLMAPEWFRVPLVILATAATVIASQALISGTFSIAAQAIQLGFWPRMTVLHTSVREHGQIYLPAINWGLFAAVVVLVLGFGSSAALASAYGIAVTAEMIITSLLAFAVLASRGSIYLKIGVGMLFGAFLLVDMAFFGANAAKVLDGGWVPLAIAGVIFFLITTWHRGRTLLQRRLHGGEMPLQAFVDAIEIAPPARVEGVAVFMTSSNKTVPHALLHNLKHNKVLHEKVLFLTIVTAATPFVDATQRLRVRQLSSGFWQLVARYGFMEAPSVPGILQLAEAALGFPLDAMQTSFFLSRETIVAARHSRFSRLRRGLFSAMHKAARRPTDFFDIPPNRVVEMGTQVEI